MKKLLPPTLFFICILLMVALWFLLPVATWLSYPLNLLGLPLVILGIGIAKRGSDLFSKRQTNIQTFDDPDLLVTDDIFRFSRNPMYLGFVIALLGVACLLGTLSSLLVVLAFFIITDRWYIAFEEQVMARTFGESYSQYRQTTRRWI